MNENTIRAFELSLSELANSFPKEAWTDDHDAAMCCRDLEEGIAASLPDLDALAGSLRDVQTSIAAGDSTSLTGLVCLRRICRMFSHLHDQLGRQADSPKWGDLMP